MARVHAEPLAGTAAVERAWLLVEVTAGWGPRGWIDSGLDAEVVDVVGRRAEEHGVRILLVRTPDRFGGTRRVMFGVTDSPTPWLTRVEVDDERWLLDLDLDLPPACPPRYGCVPDPLALVCTHAKRDVCCAVFGRATVSALETEPGLEVWESSHTGGHRFAANLLWLPTGEMFGHVDGDDAVRLVRDLRAGLLDLERYRGRSGLDRRVQSAEVALRQHLGERRQGGLTVLGLDAVGEDRSVVSLDLHGQRAHVEVARRLADTPRVTSCTKGESSRPVVLEAVGLTLTAGA